MKNHWQNLYSEFHKPVGKSFIHYILTLMIIKIGVFWQPTVTSCLIAQLATTTTMRFSARPATPRTLDPRVTGSLGVLLVSLWTQAAGMRSPLSKFYLAVLFIQTMVPFQCRMFKWFCSMELEVFFWNWKYGQ